MPVGVAFDPAATTFAVNVSWLPFAGEVELADSEVEVLNFDALPPPDAPEPPPPQLEIPNTRAAEPIRMGAICLRPRRGTNQRTTNPRIAAPPPNGQLRGCGFGALPAVTYWAFEVVIVRVVVPEPERVFGENTHDASAGRPEHEKVVVPVKPLA